MHVSRAGEKLPTRARSNVFSARRGLLTFVMLGVLALAITLWIWAPGMMSRDSGDQLEQARSLQLRDDHPVMMALLWHYTDKVLPGPLGLFALDVGLYWAGLTLLFWAIEGPLVARAMGLCVVGFWLPGFVNHPHVCKDGLMQAAIVAAVGCLVVPTARWRAARYVLALLLFTVAIGARHNASSAAWPLLSLPLLALPVLRARARWLRLIAASAVGLVLSYALTVGVDRATSPFAQKTEFWQMLPVFDLAGMSVHEGKVLVDPAAGVLTKGMGLEEIRRFYQPTYGARLYYCMAFRGKRCVPVFRHTTNPKQLEALAHNWLQAVVEHPIAYLKHRRPVVESLLGIKEGAPGAFYWKGEPHHPLAADYPPSALAARTYSWIDSQVPKLWFQPWVYVLLGCLLLPVTLIRYFRGASVLPALFLLSGLSYMLGLFIAVGSTPYKYGVYTTFCVVLALVLAIIPVVPGAWAKLRRIVARRRPGNEPPNDDEPEEPARGTRDDGWVAGGAA